MMGPAQVTLDRLIRAATDVRQTAYASYSHYRVGAAVLASDGRMFVGCNVENVSYGLSVCAERNAIGAAVSAGVSKLMIVAIVTDSDPPAAPCGACRQVVLELGIQTVVLANTEGGMKILDATDLLPMPFESKEL